VPQARAEPIQFQDDERGGSRPQQRQRLTAPSRPLAGSMMRPPLRTRSGICAPQIKPGGGTKARYPGSRGVARAMRLRVAVSRRRDQERRAPIPQPVARLTHQPLLASQRGTEGSIHPSPAGSHVRNLTTSSRSQIRLADPYPSAKPRAILNSRRGPSDAGTRRNDFSNPRLLPWRLLRRAK
jgi:hypothetical protein